MPAKNICSVCQKPLKEGTIGKTCADHIGKLRINADTATTVPANYIRMSDVCRKAVAAGLTIGAIVKASGKDACTGPLLADPLFRVTYVGSGKWMRPEVLTEGFAMLKGKAKDVPAVAKPVTTTATVTATEAALKQAVQPKPAQQVKR